MLRFCMQVHLRSHSQNKTKCNPFECSRCGKSFSQKKVLQLHIESRHKNSDGKYVVSKRGVCRTCKRLYADLERHIVHFHAKNQSATSVRVRVRARARDRDRAKEAAGDRMICKLGVNESSGVNESTVAKMDEVTPKKKRLCRRPVIADKDYITPQPLAECSKCAKHMSRFIDFEKNGSFRFQRFELADNEVLANLTRQLPRYLEILKTQAGSCTNETNRKCSVRDDAKNYAFLCSKHAYCFICAQVINMKKTRLTHNFRRHPLKFDHLARLKVFHRLDKNHHPYHHLWG
mmetsp:Transcript_14441/g.25965  ORF Transcript_14441/g.25965 Transcript_14441/m.25965 type:complete len:290 (-) Transcript_14441:388-1257(-)